MLVHVRIILVVEKELKIPRGYNSNSLESLQLKQIPVSRNKIIRLCLQGTCQDCVIVRISANGLA